MALWCFWPSLHLDYLEWQKLVVSTIYIIVTFSCLFFQFRSFNTLTIDSVWCKTEACIVHTTIIGRLFVILLLCIDFSQTQICGYILSNQTVFHIALATAEVLLGVPLVGNHCNNTCTTLSLLFFKSV